MNILIYFFLISKNEHFDFVTILPRSLKNSVFYFITFDVPSEDEPNLWDFSNQYGELKVLASGDSPQNKEFQLSMIFHDTPDMDLV